MKKASSKKITKRQLDTMPLHSDADVKRYIGFLNEIHDGNLKAIREGIMGMNERMDRMDQRFESVEKKLDSHSEMIGRLLLDMEEVKSGLRQKVDRDEFVKLEKRMVALESYVFSGKMKGK